MIRICFVCLGNICRSPTAEGVMQHLVDEAGLQDAIELDSAGTGGWHVGERADSRSRRVARSRGIELQSISRKVTAKDFEDFDYLIAMDRKNLEDLKRLRGSWKLSDKTRPHVYTADDPKLARLAMLRTFDATAPDGAEVPDPYYGNGDGFEKVLDICDRACAGLLAHLAPGRS